jgi:hypothetical protein
MESAGLLQGGEKWTAIVAIQGELGWEPINQSIDRYLLGYYGQLQLKNELSWTGKVRDAVEKEVGARASGWLKGVTAKMTEYEVDSMNEGDSVPWKTRVKGGVDTEVVRRWKTEKESRESLTHYTFKQEPKMADYWQANEGSQIIFNTLAGSLRTRYRLKQLGLREDNKCECGKVESIEHFIVECERWDTSRRKLEEMSDKTCNAVGQETPVIVEEFPRPGEEDRVGKMLGVHEKDNLESHWQKVGQILKEMWAAREKEEIQE